MAGIGFELRRIHTGHSYTSMLRSFGAAAAVTSGPWLIAVVTLLGVSLWGAQLLPDPLSLNHFQACITWLFFVSLLIAGPLQLTFTRFVSDRLYEERPELIVPNLLGAVAVVAVGASGVSVCCWHLFLEVDVAARCFLAGSLASLCCVWIVATALSALRQYVAVLCCFFFAYVATLGAILLWAPLGLPGLLAGFAFGQGVLLIGALRVVGRYCPGSGGVRLDFLMKDGRYLDLAAVGFFLNAGVWIDKVLFWFAADTGRRVLGPLHASEVYDLPFFLAYLSIIPSLSVFLVRVETDFADRHQAFYDAVNRGGSLRVIEPLRELMVDSARRGLAEICRVQALVFVLCVIVAEPALRLLGLSVLHRPLFLIDTVAVGMQALLLSVVSMFFYLDRRRTVLILGIILTVANGTLTWLSQQLSAAYHGYGFAVAVALTTLVALFWLTRAFATLVQDTFVMQPVAK